MNIFKMDHPISTMILALGLLVMLCMGFANVAWASSIQPVPKISFTYQKSTPSSDSVKGPSKKDSLILAVHIEIQEGWHINSDTPLDSFLVATTVVAKSKGIDFGKPQYPKPHIQFSKVMGGDLSLFTGAFDVMLPAKLEKGFKGSPEQTIVTLNYQACNNSMCLPPRTVSVEQ